MKRLMVVSAVVVVSLFLLSPAVLAQVNFFCEGNFDCDEDVDGSDAYVFKSDFGRSPFFNPCPVLADCPKPWAPCPSGMIICGGRCIDPMSDRDHCGADTDCLNGVICDPGEVCEGGLCILNCPTGLTNCADQCVDTNTNKDYCGSCSTVCATNQVCSGGMCVDDYPAPVPQTRQTTCYDEMGNPISCAGTGQDAEHQKGAAWPDPRFTAHGDGTVTDNLTGLMWTTDAQEIGGTYDWQDALGACNSFIFANHDDWRLPNVKELQSLIDYQNDNPALPTGHPFINVLSSYYWSSTSDAGTTNLAWVVAPGHGVCSSVNKTDSGYYYTWPVRGGH